MPTNPTVTPATTSHPELTQTLITPATIADWDRDNEQDNKMPLSSKHRWSVRIIGEPSATGGVLKPMWWDTEADKELMLDFTGETFINTPVAGEGIYSPEYIDDLLSLTATERWDPTGQKIVVDSIECKLLLEHVYQNDVPMSEFVLNKPMYVFRDGKPYGVFNIDSIDGDEETVTVKGTDIRGLLASQTTIHPYFKRRKVNSTVTSPDEIIAPEGPEYDYVDQYSGTYRKSLHELDVVSLRFFLFSLLSSFNWKENGVTYPFTAIRDTNMFRPYISGVFESPDGVLVYDETDGTISDITDALAYTGASFMRTQRGTIELYKESGVDAPDWSTAEAYLVPMSAVYSDVKPIHYDVERYDEFRPVSYSFKYPSYSEYDPNAQYPKIKVDGAISLSREAANEALIEPQPGGTTHMYRVPNAIYDPDKGIVPDGFDDPPAGSNRTVRIPFKVSVKVKPSVVGTSPWYPEQVKITPVPPWESHHSGFWSTTWFGCMYSQGIYTVDQEFSAAMNSNIEAVQTGLICCPSIESKNGSTGAGVLSNKYSCPQLSRASQEVRTALDAALLARVNSCSDRGYSWEMRDDPSLHAGRFVQIEVKPDKWARCRLTKVTHKIAEGQRMDCEAMFISDVRVSRPTMPSFSGTWSWEDGLFSADLTALSSWVDGLIAGGKDPSRMFFRIKAGTTTLCEVPIYTLEPQAATEDPGSRVVSLEFLYVTDFATYSQGTQALTKA